MTAAQRALSLLEFMRADPESDALLEALVTAWTVGLERPAEVAYADPDAGVGTWQRLCDPQHAPLWALPHAALYTGGVMPIRLPGESDTAYLERARAEVIRPQGMFRGGHAALILAVQRHLTGTKSVSIVERIDGSVWRIAVRVRTAECPDVAAVEAAANAPDVIPAGMRAVVILADGSIWDEPTIAWDQAGAVTWDDAVTQPLP